MHVRKSFIGAAAALAVIPAGTALRRDHPGWSTAARTCAGRNAPDHIDGNGGNDRIHGFAGDDELIGGPGNDRVFGGRGNDTIRGVQGNDWLNGGAGRRHGRSATPTTPAT